MGTPRHPFPLLRACAAALLLGAFARPALAVPSFDEVRRDHQPSDTLVLDRRGEVIHRLRSDGTVRRGEWIALDDISPALRHAMLASEDKRFWEHSGIDWRSVSAAAWGRLWHQRTRGASTITMQLAGLVDGDWRQRGGGRSVTQKLGQAVAAQVLDLQWRKDQVLEAYLNLVPFRGEIVGIAALSHTLFGKAPHGLDAEEAAIAAALVRAPNATPALVTRRACGVLKAMQDGRADCSGLDMHVSGALQRRSFDPSEGIAPHLARLATKQAAGARRVATTLRADLQRFAVRTLGQHLRELQRRNVEDGAVVVLDNASGEVLAWVGSSGDLSRAGEVDGVTALRQAGSTLKPFLYAQAIADRRLTAASLLDDSPAHIATAGGLYIPQNYDRQFKGWVSVRTALGASLNVPAVRTLVMVSPQDFHRQLVAAGLPLRQSGDHYGYSLALGSAEVPLLGLANAYRTLANQGRFGAPRWLPLAKGAAAPAAKQAIDARAAFVVGDILSDPNARARTFGTDSLLATRYWSAVKTGTSKDMRDNWAVGWSQRYTVAVWVGNASGAPMHDVSGTSGAAPVWAAVMGYLHAREPSRAPVAPAGMVRQEVKFGDGLEAGRVEWFLPGTEQAVMALEKAGVPFGYPSLRDLRGLRGAVDRRLAVSAAHPSTPPRITAPANGTILALDPDIPPQRQRLALRAEGAGKLQWRVDGKPLARGAEAGWLPWPGRHVLQLVAGGKVVDEVKVEVRGAGVKGVAPKP